MAVATPSPLHVSQDFERRIEFGFDQLKSKFSFVLSRALTNKISAEVFNFLDHERVSREKLQQLEKELDVYKRAVDGLRADCGRLEALQNETLKENERLQDLVKGHRVITLIDGDGAIFSKDLISQGQQGGHHAARTLSDAINKYLSANYGNKPYQLWVYLFYNRRGLTDTFNRVVGLGSLSKTLEEFHVGFNQATERFVMVDVGSLKEAADAKLKVHLQDDIQLPQTFKINLGCHDSGYVASLRSQITAGFGEKLILLKGYTQMAAQIAALDLPVLEIPDLFMTHKLTPTNRWAIPLTSLNQMVTNTNIATPDDWSKMSIAESDEVESSGTSYSRVLQRAAAPNLRTRERSPSSTEASCETSYVQGSPGTRHVNPDVVESFTYSPIEAQTASLHPVLSVQLQAWIEVQIRA
ncbi:hypothetical protein MSAN_01434800 [Mycena sanguinolenta]|uniref:DUF7923 domain-containing protein n=1 Tax=Mycena sanguinolenta TaxID=230812 RepID=A0A8H6YB64_9AGAR|nr:hypothetical protein MSAN_01434800 [Mycena sanguinolenta]